MNDLTLPLGKPQPKQKEFFMAHTRYVAYGGGRGGGKSWAVREKAKRLAMRWAGIKILIIRRALIDLKTNHIDPLRAEIPEVIAKYNRQDNMMRFINGSTIQFSYFKTENDGEKYRGQEFDIIFLEEATQFLENVFTVLKGCLRGVNEFPKRIYLTCNPDGIGFSWVKRLFVTRDFMDDEDPNDYMFIQALLYDNQVLMQADPGYEKQLMSLPEDMRKRWLYGSWDVAEGQMFDDFDRRVHVIEPCLLDPSWRRYVAFDYGLDKAAVYWIAVDRYGRSYVYKELWESNLIISKTAEKILEMNGDDNIYAYLAPPDLWFRTQETGKSKAELFYEAGITLTKTSNDREAGWLAIKEMLKKKEDGIPGILIFNTCKNLIQSLIEILRDPKKPNDCMIEPHEITHSADALRGFCIYWVSPNKETTVKHVHYSPDRLEDYRNARSQAERDAIIKRMGGLPE